MEGKRRVEHGRVADLLGERQPLGGILERGRDIAPRQPDGAANLPARWLHLVAGARLGLGHELIRDPSGRVPAATPVVLDDPLGHQVAHVAAEPETFRHPQPLRLQLEAASQLDQGAGEVDVGDDAVR